MECTAEWVKRTKIGDLVVALDSGNGMFEGNVYRVAKIEEGFNEPTDKVVVCFGLEGFDYSEYGFPWCCFKPAVNRGVEGGMKILREILNGQPVREDA